MRLKKTGVGIYNLLVLKLFNGVESFKKNGLTTILNAVFKRRSYQRWVTKYDTLTDAHRKSISVKVSHLKYKPLISVVMPVYNTPEKWLKLAIESVLKQLYPHWELCIADDASSVEHVKTILQSYQKQDPRIKVTFRQTNGHISAASNSALELAAGEFIALLDHDDELAEHALYEIAAEINRYPKAALIYSDEDKLNSNGRRVEPYFKSDWNPDLLYGHNFISHLGVYRRSIVNEIGGFREGYEGSQDYDLALRVIEKISAERIRHIPKILYHWRMIPGSVALNINSKNYAYTAARKAIQSHLTRTGAMNAQVEPDSVLPTSNKVVYSLPKIVPLVSIVIPTKDKVALLRQCVESVLHKTAYANFEIIIINNQSVEQKTQDYFNQLKQEPKVKIIAYDFPFNYSKMNNFAVTHAARGEVIIFLNNDTEVIFSDWLTEMVSHAMRPEIGVVGAKLYYPKGTIQHAGVIGNLQAKGGAGHIYRGLAKDKHGYIGKACLIQNFLAVTGACMMMRRSVFEELGGFEETLAVDYNDVDICLRAYKANYRVLWTPYVELYHHESATINSLHIRKNKVQKKREVDYMQANWGDILENDPFYNPNLSLHNPNCALAFPPRHYRQHE